MNAVLATIGQFYKFKFHQNWHIGAINFCYKLYDLRELVYNVAQFRLARFRLKTRFKIPNTC